MVLCRVNANVCAADPARARGRTKHAADRPAVSRPFAIIWRSARPDPASSRSCHETRIGDLDTRWVGDLITLRDLRPSVPRCARSAVRRGGRRVGVSSDAAQESMFGAQVPAEVVIELRGVYRGGPLDIFQVILATPRSKISAAAATILSRVA
jgi:hypothetical protein